jgi:hypothetical protein
MAWRSNGAKVSGCIFRLTADKITQIFGVRKHQRTRGKLHSMLERLDHGKSCAAHLCKSLVARMYEKFATFLRLEICVNRLKDLGLNKGVENLNALRQKLVAPTDPPDQSRGRTAQRPRGLPAVPSPSGSLLRSIKVS